MGLKEELIRRRTFGIVSHPDAGKTTLTEKLLLFGGAIHVAGAVKSNKIKKGATSDFMEIERQRGISVATSVMGFEYNGYKINILDTPGHQDFQEDTFRTLTAVDSVIIVIDAAKGVEPQTEKLMAVCRMRKTPVLIFINKMDRPTGDTFDLLDDISDRIRRKEFETLGGFGCKTCRAAQQCGFKSLSASVAKIQALRECPRKYKFRYLDRATVPDKERPALVLNQVLRDFAIST